MGSKYVYIKRSLLTSKYMQWAAERLSKGENPSDYAAFKRYDIDTGGGGTDEELQDKGWIGIQPVVSSIVPQLLFPVAVGYGCVVTQSFGPSSDSALQRFYESLGYVGHHGVDIASTISAYQVSGIVPIAACDDGVAYAKRSDPTAGNFIVIEHTHGTSRVLHLDSITDYIRYSGSWVARGEHLGYIGDTGSARGVHVHWDYKPKDADEDNGYKGRIDPMSLDVVYT